MLASPSFHDVLKVFPHLVAEWLRGHVYQRSRQEIDDILERGRAVGIPDLTFRMCRTTFATLFDGDEADRSSIMGHTSTKFTLERYRKPIMERRQRSVEEMDRRLKVVPITRIAV
jgi:integrase